MKRVVEINLTKTEREAVISYLKGTLSSRQLGKILGRSHQGAINTVSTLCREWIQSGELILKLKAKGRDQ